MQPEPVVIDRVGHTTPLHRLGALPAPKDQPLPEVACRIRALRAQALELLPLCQDLSREEASAVEHQIDLLADVLAVGVRLAHEVA